MTTIYLGYTFLHTSSHPQTAEQAMCHVWVLHQMGFTRQFDLPNRGELLPRLFILTDIFSAVFFCCTFLRVTSTGSYPAPCSVMLGLSSYGALLLPPATVWSTHKIMITKPMQKVKQIKNSYKRSSVEYLTQCTL